MQRHSRCLVTLCALRKDGNIDKTGNKEKDKKHGKKGRSKKKNVIKKIYIKYGQIDIYVDR